MWLHWRAHCGRTVGNGGYEPVVVDNLSNSTTGGLDRLGLLFRHSPIAFRQLDLSDLQALRTAFTDHGPFDAVIHLAGLKSVEESTQNPLLYFDNNLSSTLCLLRVCEEHKCLRIVFSSSATVYGKPRTADPITEDAPIAPVNPYGISKAMNEQILQSVAAAPSSGWQVTILRYANPIGAHTSGLVGEAPKQMARNLLPAVMAVAARASNPGEPVVVFGSNWPTCDGTGERDYIDVCDLAHGHVLALAAMFKRPDSAADGQCKVYNLGTGHALSVLQVLDAVERVSGRAVPRIYAAPRAGDVARVVLCPDKARRELGFIASCKFGDSVYRAWSWAAGAK